jgi:hypothetical protein
MKLVKVGIVLCLLISIAIAGGRQDQPSFSGDDNLYDKYENGSQSADSSDDHTKKMTSDQDQKEKSAYDKRSKNSKSARQNDAKKSKFIDQAAKKKTVRSRENDDIDNDKNRVHYDKKNLKQKRKDTGTKLKKDAR